MSKSSLLSSTLVDLLAQKYNLVTREEFDAQCKLLEQSQTRILELEQQLAELEKLAVSSSDNATSVNPTSINATPASTSEENSSAENPSIDN